ncbi:hypothetical protein D3C72_2114350 [compost metagenome]
MLLGLAGYHGQFAIGLIERDQGRVFLVQQEIRGIVEVPVALLVDADQHRLEARTVQCIDNVFRRLQRHLVLSRPPAKNNAHTQFTHCLTS